MSNDHLLESTAVIFLITSMVPGGTLEIIWVGGVCHWHPGSLGLYQTMINCNFATLF